VTAGIQRDPEKQPILLNSEEPLVLMGTGGAWHVESGSLAVFAVETLNGASGRRQFLFSAGAGDLLFGLEAADPERTVVAIPTEPSTVLPVSAIEPRYVRGVERWCAHVSRLLSIFAIPDEALPVPHGNAVESRAISWQEPHPGWILVLSGSAWVAGRGVEIRAGSVVPMAEGLWLGAPSAFEVERITRDAAERLNRIDGIASISSVLLEALRETERRSQSQEKSRLDQRRQFESHMGAAALAGLSGAEQQLGAAAEPPLVSAARLVARSLGLEVHAPADPGPREHPVAAIATASGFRTRRVLLTGAWWNQDNGPILAFRLGDQLPVALIPYRTFHGGCRYRLIHPLDGSAIPVDRKTAASLDSVGFSFYRRFGTGTALLDLFRFAIRPYRRDLLLLVLCSLAAGLLGMAVPAGNSILFGQAIPDADRSLLWQVALGMGAAVFGSTLFNLAQSFSMVRIQSGMTTALQCGIWDRLLRLSPAFFRRFNVGDLWIRVDAVERVRRQLTMGALTAIFTGVASLFQIGLMFYYSAQLALIACVAGLLILGTTAAALRTLYEREATHQKLEGFLSGFVVQLVNSVGKLRVAGAEGRAFARWAGSFGQKQKVTLQIRRIRDGIHVLNTTVPALATACIFAWLSRTPDSPALSIGAYLAFAASFGTFLSGMVNLSETIASLSVATVWRRARPVLEEAPEIQSVKAHPGRIAGRIKFDHVDFRYGSAGPLTLKNINLEVQPGECVALVGASGSGKSTILSLLLQFEAPASGAIYVDGQDLSTLDIGAVRRQFGVVNQDSRLIAQSVFENIVCGSLCTLSEAWEAARAAAVDGDIEAMPMGMHTIVSEGGSNLSGGQRQRILIARALVQKPAVLILDEATAALDNNTQRTVTESLSRLHTTRILVAHRLSTIRNADRIYVIRSGEIVEQGAYDDLVAAGGPFFDLVKNQLAR
jgi:NHLM bacteriocin system ABC transporter ATP-binding protein